MTQPTARPARADAVRNRAAILGAARGQIAERGLDVGMDQIAAAAGVAVGTLYRHFPTKTDLVAAVVDAFVTEVADEVEAALVRVQGGSAAYVELAGLWRSIVRAAASDQAVRAATCALDTKAGDPGDVARAGHALSTLIDAARSDGTVRDDLTLDDFYLLVSHAPDGQPPAVLDRWADLVLLGIVGPTRP